MTDPSQDRPAVLIIDDEPTNIQALYAPLKDAFQGRFATSGEQGLTLARDLRPSVVLLDINLPGMDGFAVLEALRAEPETRGCMVAFVSGDDDPELIERAMQAGGDDFLVKPCPPPLLARRVALLDELRRLRAASAAAPTADSARRAPLPPGSRRILVVEDGEINRVILWEMLRAMGHDVTMAVSGEEGLARLDEDSFDAVLLDIHLPGIDGIEVARRLRAGAGAAEGEQPWLVAVTGDAVPGSTTAYRSAGFDAVVRKPVDPDVLAAALSGDSAAGAETPIENPVPELLIDRERIGILRRTYAGPRLKALFDLLERETAGYRATIRAACEAGDHATLRSASHRLKSALGHFACARAARLADHLAHGEGRPMEQVRHDVDTLEQIVPETLRALRGALDLVDDRPG